MCAQNSVYYISIMNMTNDVGVNVNSQCIIIGEVLICLSLSF